MSLQQKALEMRNAIDDMEIALSALGGLADVARLWCDAQDDLRIKVKMTVGNVRQIRNAYDELNRIINLPEYIPAKLSE
jgi:hypothetical protein